MPKLNQYLLKCIGWKINGQLPDLRKYVIGVGPHTSNWDFIVGILARPAMGLGGKGNFLGKGSLFKSPFGFIFRALGGIPVERSKSNNMVHGIVEEINKREEFILVVAPEGTRSKVERLKTGFYHIAKEAGIPIILTGMDFKTKTVYISELLYPSDFDTDMKFIWDYFAQYDGLNTELGIH